ncbi:MAG: hypothetical protein FWF54_05235 [Candidatus Azobacteroides sp.]|nr:hypothetical protein [Candidatus Azobacteroides sp.]
MVADKLMTTSFAQIILLLLYFLPFFFIFVLWQSGQWRVIFTFTHKNNAFSLLANFLAQHTFYNTTNLLKEGRMTTT